LDDFNWRRIGHFCCGRPDGGEAAKKAVLPRTCWGFASEQDPEHGRCVHDFGAMGFHSIESRSIPPQGGTRREAPAHGQLGLGAHRVPRSGLLWRHCATRGGLCPLLKKTGVEIQRCSTIMVCQRASFRRSRRQRPGDSINEMPRAWSVPETVAVMRTRCFAVEQRGRTAAPVGAGRGKVAWLRRDGPKVERLAPPTGTNGGPIGHYGQTPWRAGRTTAHAEVGGGTAFGAIGTNLPRTVGCFLCPVSHQRRPFPPTPRCLMLPLILSTE